MGKVRITENAMLQIVTGVFNEIDIKFEENDISVPPDWRGKTINEAINIDYYTFKYRPLSTTELIAKKVQDNATRIDNLESLKRSFCLLYLGQVKRVFAKDIDKAEIPVNLEFWVQTNKIQLLETLISECNIGLIGERITVQIGAETRRAAIVFGNLNVIDVVTGLPCGEMTTVTCECTVELSPDIYDYSDYKITIVWDSYSVDLPIYDLSIEENMTAKSVPYVNTPQSTGNINLASADVFTLGFYGLNNSFVNFITNNTLADSSNKENNKVFKMTIRRGNSSYECNVVISRHTINVQPGTGYETHTLTLVRKGLR